MVIENLCTQDNNLTTFEVGGIVDFSGNGQHELAGQANTLMPCGLLARILGQPDRLKGIVKTRHLTEEGADGGPSHFALVQRAISAAYGHQLLSCKVGDTTTTWGTPTTCIGTDLASAEGLPIVTAAA